DFAAGSGQRGVQGGGLASLGNGEEFDFRAAREAAHDRPGGVGGAVGYDQNFHQFAGVVQGQDGLQFGGYPAFAVVDGQDHGDGGGPCCFAHRPPPPSCQQTEQQRVAE